MGTCYTYLLYDSFDWGSYYDGEKTKKETIEAIKKELPVAEIKAQWPYFIVVDLDKNSPWGEKVQILSKYCDWAKYYGDSSEWDIRDVEFKKDPIEEASKPENRNAKHIAEAYEDWKRKYYETGYRI